MLKKYLKIYLHFFKMNILRRMAYRWNFFILMIMIPLHIGIYIFFIKIIYSNLESIAGWDFYHSLLIVASMVFIEATAWATCSFMNELRRYIRDGNLDGVITKPIDAQFLASVSKVDPEDLSRFIIAIGIIIYVLSHIHFSLIDFLLYFFILFNGFIIFYSILVLIAVIAFWVVENRALFFISKNIIQISQYPTDIYTGIMKTVFSFIIPIAFIATVPAKVLSGWYDWKLVMESFIIAGIFFYLSRKFFLFGLRHYSSASS
ncbi:MAG: ABC-2 family transporter protein [bacterium]